jgi:predicted metal-dependent hydrolase/CheY-like chemotaxis protein
VTTLPTAAPATGFITPASAVVVLSSDPLVAEQISAVLRTQGGQPLVVPTPAEFVVALDRYFPVLALFDLDAASEVASPKWEEAITRCKLRPHTRSIPIYAFGAHVEQATLRVAREAGADEAWTFNRLSAELPALVQRYLNPPISYPAGWDEPLSEEARAGVAAFNAGDYFEQHEHFEHAWMAEPRPIRELYQGILQVGVAYYQIQRGNWAGALKMFRRGLPRLRGLPPVCQGIRLDRFRTVAEAIHAEVTELGPKRLAKFDQQRFPQIELELIEPMCDDK